jgi:hypothetical protein
MMDIEILFHTSSAPKIIENVQAVYTKDGLLCIQYHGVYTGTIPKYKGYVGIWILKYPLCNVFHVFGPHGDHGGTNTAPSINGENK